jgi:SPP1 gp7 family putative phage head morphogenesis protein
MATAAQAFAALFALTPEGALRYLQERDLLRVTYNWAELWQDEHTRQFTVSRLASADLLALIRQLIIDSVGGDLSRTDYLRDARTALQRAGWWGTSEATDPASGEIVRTTFNAARLKLIYDTNTRMAYAAGQWERIEATRRTHPYLRYVTQRDDKVRPAHRSWDGVTLPSDDSFWASHMPPNGWRCRCRVVQVNRRDYERGTTPTGAPMKKERPEVVMRDWLDKATGEVRQVPAGIDPGFGYNPGQARDRALQRVVADKGRALPSDVAGALRAQLKRDQERKP